MADLFRILATLHEQMQATLSRSDILRALIWPLGLSLTAVLTALYLRAPSWLLVAFFVFFVLFALLYAGAYIFCLLIDRDALRSERYTIEKMAIQQGILGDSSRGVLPDSEIKKLPSATEAEKPE